MKVHLLLLLALAGPLCSFTRASPTGNPTGGDRETPVTETATSVPIITGPPPTSPKSLPDVVMVSTDGSVAVPGDHTDVSTVTPDLATSTIAVQADITTAFASTVDATASDEKTLPPPVTTAAAFLKTTSLDKIDGPSPTGTEVLAGPTQSGDTTEASESGDKVELVEIEDDMEEGLGTGQIVGIVIGAIVAVVIVTAVVIAMLRKMGKYSP